MDHRHLRQGIGHDQSDACPQEIGKNDRGSSEANGYTASQEQTDTDGATNGHHGELPLAQPAVQTFHVRRRKRLTGKRGPDR